MFLKASATPCIFFVTCPNSPPLSPCRLSATNALHAESGFLFGSLNSAILLSSRRSLTAWTSGFTGFGTFLTAFLTTLGLGLALSLGLAFALVAAAFLATGFFALIAVVFFAVVALAAATFVVVLGCPAEAKWRAPLYREPETRTDESGALERMAKVRDGTAATLMPMRRIAARLATESMAAASYAQSMEWSCLVTKFAILAGWQLRGMRSIGGRRAVVLMSGLCVQRWLGPLRSSGGFMQPDVGTVLFLLSRETLMHTEASLPPVTTSGGGGLGTHLDLELHGKPLSFATLDKLSTRGPEFLDAGWLPSIGPVNQFNSPPKTCTAPRLEKSEYTSRYLWRTSMKVWLRSLSLGSKSGHSQGI